jgi:predicted CXXCH cytochrome family protein
MLHIFVWVVLGAAVWTMAAPLTPVAQTAGLQTPSGVTPSVNQAAIVPSYVPPNHPVVTTQPAESHNVPLRAQPRPVKMVPPDPRAGQVAKPTVAIKNENCVTSACHATVKNFKVVHGPVNVNSCDACHKLVDEKKHHFEQRRVKAETCTFCHQARKPLDAVVHKPVETGDCTGCHNPHGGNDKRFLHGNTMAELCARCHDDKIFAKKAVHGPAALGACEACHQPHSSKFPKLVNAQGTDLCYSCHDQMKAQLASAKFVHKAVTEKGCNECHDTHASDYSKQLVKAPQDLCISCHKPIEQVMLTSAVKHTAVTSDNGCMNCHTPHGGPRAKLMKGAANETCLKCHDKPIQVVAANHVVPSIDIVKDPSQSKHGPIRDGDCTGCHAPHGGNNNRLLAKAFPDTFYQSFDVTKYDLCFSCHDKNLVLQAKTNALTKFRNGEQNLHYLHVNKSDKGRSCRACHEVHSSKQPVHLRESVPFGKWEMPLSFNQTPTGGSCRPGCHTEMKYDRQNPVSNKPVMASGGR